MQRDLRRATYPRRALLPAGVAVLSMVSLLSALPAQADTGNAGAGNTAKSAPSRPPLTASEAGTSAYMESVRTDPERLRGFLRDLPKGGDLHNHLSGAVSTETLIELAGQDGLCIETDTMKAVPAPCGPGTRPAADARTDRSFHQEILRAWSMEGFEKGGDESGHDHFFATFGKFGEVTWRHPGKLLSEVTDDVAEQNQSYLETMATPASESAKKVADGLGWENDLAAMHRKLVADGKLDRLVAEARKEADRTEAGFRRESRCGTDEAAPGCDVTMRWISQVARLSSKERVFTQIALGLRLAQEDPRFAAVNLVQPEDGETALRDYRLHMRMVGYLEDRYPRAHVTLHAGELWPGLVKPEDLTFHIDDAVKVAGAERIGHGVDLRYEDNWRELARTMARREVAVEVPFTSNAQILGVTGNDHPFESYRRYGVPVVLATDDPGVSRSNITRDYVHAATTYDLRYTELKDLARASLEYSFLSGRSLWRGNPTRQGYHLDSACRGERPGSGNPDAACEQFLKDSPKAALQWQQEKAYASFERTVSSRH